MSKFQREVDEHKKQLQQTGAYYSNKSSQSIAKPSWMNKPAPKPAVKPEPFDLNSNPLNGRAPHINKDDLIIGSVPVLGGWPEISEFPISGNMANKAVSVFEELIPFLRGFIP